MGHFRISRSDATFIPQENQKQNGFDRPASIGGGSTRMFSHIMIGTNDLEKAKVFYDALLGEFHRAGRRVSRGRPHPWRQDLRGPAGHPRRRRDQALYRLCARSRRQQALCPAPGGTSRADGSKKRSRIPLRSSGKQHSNRLVISSIGGLPHLSRRMSAEGCDGHHEMSDPGADSELGHGSGKSVGPVWRHPTDDALAWMEGREMAKRH